MRPRVLFKIVDGEQDRYVTDLPAVTIDEDINFVTTFSFEGKRYKIAGMKKGENMEGEFHETVTYLLKEY